MDLGIEMASAAQASSADFLVKNQALEGCEKKSPAMKRALRECIFFRQTDKMGPVKIIITS